MIGVVDYGMGNIKSVTNAFEYIGASVMIIRSVQDLSKVDKIILPGVGAFGVGIKNLAKLNMIEALNNEIIVNKKPFLGICLGMQLICKESFEFGHFYGFGWIDASVRRFENDLGVRIPHVGWNNINIKQHNKLISYGKDDLNVYFVHSYYVDVVERNIITATCIYGHEFVACLEKDNIFATQFHPEKSQHIGLNMLKKFIDL